MQNQLRSLWDSRWAEPILVLVLFAVALGVRLPDLLLIPPYTDEGGQVLWAVEIARGHNFPLTAVDAYMGPLFAYLVAALLRVFGFSILLPRLFIALLGALTVPIAYWAGRLMRDRAAGLIAAALVLVSPLLVVFSSHTGWSSAMTPFFAVLTVALLYDGVVNRRTGLFVLSGLTAACMLQSHPTSAVALVGMAIWFLARPDARAWLRRPAPYLAAALFFVGYAPMLIANLRLNSPMLSEATQRDYAFVPTLDPLEYLRRLVVMLRIGGFFVGGGIGEASIALRITAIVVEIALVAALLQAWRDRNRLIPIAMLSSTALLPFFVVGDSYRYYVYLIPMAYILLGILGAAIARALWVNRSGIASIIEVRRAAKAVSVALMLVYLVFPLFTIFGYYREAMAEGATNAGYFRIEDALKAGGACDAGVFVEEVGLTPGSPDLATSFALNSMDYVLTLENCHPDQVGRAEIAQRLAAQGGGWLIIPPASVGAFASQFEMRWVDTFSAPEFQTDHAPISLYYARPRP